MKSSQKPHEILKTFSATFLFLFIWQVALLRHWANLKVSLSGWTTLLFCLLVVWLVLGLGEKCWVSPKSANTVWGSECLSFWKEDTSSCFFLSLRKCESCKCALFYELIRDCTALSHADALRNVIWSLEVLYFKMHLKEFNGQVVQTWDFWKFSHISHNILYCTFMQIFHVVFQLQH